MTRKRALVIGASGGIGRAISERLGGEGWHVLAHGRRRDALDETLGAVSAHGGSAEALTAELTDAAALDALCARVAGEKRLDAVVWSAGGGRSVDSGPEALPKWDRTLQATLLAPMRVTALLLPQLRAAHGSVLYICGMYAKIGMARMAAHCAGRHGLEGFCKALFEEVREDGVGVTLLHPGFVHTGLTDTARLDPDRMIHAAEIAAMAVLALSMPSRTCVTEMTVRPQRSPYR